MFVFPSVWSRLFLLLLLLLLFMLQQTNQMYISSVKSQKIYIFALTHGKNLANFNNSNVHLLQRASVKCPKCWHVVANCLIYVRIYVFAGVHPHTYTCKHTNAPMCVYLYLHVYSIFDGNENVTVFVATAAAAFFLMIVSKSFVWSKNNYADERIQIYPPPHYKIQKDTHMDTYIKMYTQTYLMCKKKHKFCIFPPNSFTLGVNQPASIAAL